MIILSNCLSDKADEGCLKVAGSLIRRLRQKLPGTTVVTYGDSEGQGDLHLKVNKLMLSPRLLKLIRAKNEPLLYVPAAARARAMAVWVLILSLFARKGIRMICVMQHETGWLPGLLLKLSGVHIIALSRSTAEYYEAILPGRVTYLKTGVDTTRFQPVTPEEKAALKVRFGIPADKTVVLHVGHLKQGRNVQQLLKLDDRFHGVLVCSTYAAGQQDGQLREALKQKSNLTLLEGYIPRIEEIYQMADVYLFPVVIPHNCIDVPLSALEAAACGIPVVTTAYGEMQELLGKDGFYEIRSFEPEELNNLLATAYAQEKNPRQHVLQYDWNEAVDQLCTF